MNKKEIINSISIIEKELTKIKNNFKDKNIKVQSNSQKKGIDNTILKLIHNHGWKEAIDSSFICYDEESKFDRAENIIETLLNDELENKKILDYGCGEGHVIKELEKYNTNLSIGFDIDQPELDSVWKNANCVTDFNLIEKEKPYDYIIIYDVIDHIINETQEEFLNRIKSLCSEKTKIIIRCHPFSSRHGGHLYKDLNRAWIHLILNEDELKYLNLKMNPILKILFPQKHYQDLFNKTKLKVKNLEITKDDVDLFFTKQPNINKRIKEIYKTNNFPKSSIEKSFLDYVLTL